MAGYPITLQLDNKEVLIIGGGKVAARKVPALLAAGAKVTILSPTLDESLNGLSFYWVKGEYKQDFLKSSKYLLVFVATDNPQVNQVVAQDAKYHTPWVNVVDDSAPSTFHNMAVVEKGPFTIAISSNGNSPAILRLIKERIDSLKLDGLQTLGIWLGNLRSVARVTVDTQVQRQALYESIIKSEILSLLESGKIDEAKALFDAMVEEAL